MSGTPYRFVIPATEGNIDIRLGSIGLPSLASMSTEDRLIMTLFFKGGSCLCVRETESGSDLTLKGGYPLKT